MTVNFRTLVLSLAIVAACANNVAQNKNSGPDGSYKAAKELQLVNNEAIATGIVTYPGSDRSDWKVVEIPDKKVGTLDLKLSWTPPRPGLQLAFDVFDEYFHEAIKSTASARKKKGRTKSESAPNMTGKVYIRVYAVNRGDAGKYKLTVEFKENPVGVPPDPGGLQIPDPPRLPDVPPIPLLCDDTNFDPKKPECKTFCPTSGAPPKWPPCGDTCTTPDPENMVCWRKADTRPPCPKPWDPRFKQWCPPPPCPSPPDPANPNCAAKPIAARVVKKEINGGDTIATVAAGSTQGVGKDWKATVLRGDTEAPLPGGDGTIIRVDKTSTTIKFHMTPDTLDANNRVRLSPP